MAKYSTGSGGGSAGASCELCGSDDDDLRTATVAGATLQVCGDCAQHDESSSDAGQTSDDRSDEQERRRKAAQNAAKLHDAGKGDAGHWEEGADYDDDQLPYLVDDYGLRLTEARQDEGLQIDELADAIDAEESDVLAVEQGRAAQAGVGGSVITALEDRLDVDLAE